jgi:PDZ domain/Aspartyl protease
MKKIHTNTCKNAMNLNELTASVRKKNHFCFICGRLCAWIGVFFLYGCSPKLLPAEFSGMSFLFDKPSVNVPFKFINNLVIIPLHINNSDSLFFILDTGVKTTLITELNPNDTMTLNYTRKRRIKGLGHGDDLEALHAYDNRFLLGSIAGRKMDLFILIKDVFFLSSRMGTQVNGLIGYDIFQKFPVRLDYDRQVMTVYNPRHFKKIKKGELIPLSIEGGKPYIQTKVEIEKGKWIDVKLIIDSGASHALSLELNDSLGIVLPEKTVDAYLGRGLNGDVLGKIGRLNSLKIGKYELKNINTAFPDTASMHGLTGIAHRNGSLGSSILKRFHIIFDYSHNQLYLRPNTNFNKEFYPNMSGLEVSSPIPGLKYYVISQLTNNMPAMEAGLQLGDELVSINGQSTFRLDMNEINLILQSKPGRKIRLEVRRSGQLIKVSIVLKLVV